MIVLDASAVLALLRAEPGAGVVSESLRRDEAVLSAANWAEVAGKTVDVGGDVVAVRQVVLGVARIVPVEPDDATLAGALRSEEWARPLSLGDRLCLALGVRLQDATVLTSDQAWKAVRLPVRVTLIR